MKQYSFYNVDLLVNSVPIEGFPEQAGMITAARSVAQHGHVMDNRGNMAVATSANKSGVIGFTLYQTSPSDKFLRSLATVAQAAGTSGNAAEFVPIVATINDKMGGQKVQGTNGYINVQPSFIRGAGIATLNYTITFETLIFPEEGSVSGAEIIS